MFEIKGAVVGVRKASLPNDTEFIIRLLGYIDLSIYPEATDIENPDDQWFVYEDKEEIIGSVAARRSRGELRHMVVLPSHRRKGLGRKLAKCAIEFLRGMGYSTVWAQVRARNKDSQRFFESLGFKRDSRLRTSLKDPEVKLYRYRLVS